MEPVTVGTGARDFRSLNTSNVVDENEIRNCQYPGCVAPVPPVTGRGRPPRYCGETVLGAVHNRGNALARRAQLARVGVDVERAASEPVTVARATAGDLVGRIETTVREQAVMAERLLEALRTMDSPEQAAAQAAAATETARAERAVADAERLAADQRADIATREAEQARADAADADAEASAAVQAAEAAEQARAEADRARAALAGQLAAEEAGHLDTAQALDEQRTRADAAEIEAERVAGEFQRSLAETRTAREELAQVRKELARARAETADLNAELRAVETASARFEAEADRQAAAATAARSERDDARGQVEQARAQVDLARADLAAAREHAENLTARAVTAEAQLVALASRSGDVEPSGVEAP